MGGLAHCRSAHLACAAFRALALSCAFVSFAARALPPRATAAGSLAFSTFFFGVDAPVAWSTMDRAIWLKSFLRELFSMVY
jgi:hypothetical protein